MREKVFLVLMSLFLCLAGCDGDGDGVDAGAAAPEFEMPDLSGMTWVLGQGTVDVPAGTDYVRLKSFQITEPGEVRAAVSWTTGPAQMKTVEVGCLDACCGEWVVDQASPVELTQDVPQAVVDAGPNWHLSVRNTTGPDASVHYTLYFTPD